MKINSNINIGDEVIYHNEKCKVLSFIITNHKNQDKEIWGNNETLILVNYIPLIQEKYVTKTYTEYLKSHTDNLVELNNKYNLGDKFYDKHTKKYFTVNEIYIHLLSNNEISYDYKFSNDYEQNEEIIEMFLEDKDWIKIKNI